ncbi:hypothetical protein J4407_00655 [Candidatus Pacearchaeota archaeon]|nr:hypothetical protein [Candidatus Pacearchaeota archaeon]
MARKKRAKRISKRSSRKSYQNISSKEAPTRKTNLALKNLLIFAVIFGISLGFYKNLSNILAVNFFGVISLLSGFVTLAFLIVYLILVIRNWLRR